MRLSFSLFLLAAGWLFPTFNSAQSTGFHARKQDEIMRIATSDGISAQYVISDPDLYGERWDTLKQACFWREIMRLPASISLVNVASTRQILSAIETERWNCMTSIQRDTYKDSLKLANGIDTSMSVFVTFGKNHFYRFRDVLPSISQGIEIFRQEATDPWYAQAILLIESPAQLKKSTTGAYGPFQLMKSVAIAHGLKVNKYVDERADFDKSARGAASLIRKVCIPYARAILDGHGVVYSEDELWFRLFVMHVYHAGAGNVRRVADVIQPTQGGKDFIRTMWRTEAGGFKNASQNYSQLVLASLLELEDIILHEWEYVCEGPKQ